MLEHTPHNYFLDFSSSYSTVKAVLEEYGYVQSEYDSAHNVFFKKGDALVQVYNSEMLFYPYLITLAENAKISKHDFIASLAVMNKK